LILSADTIYCGLIFIFAVFISNTFHNFSQFPFSCWISLPCCWLSCLGVGLISYIHLSVYLNPLWVTDHFNSGLLNSLWDILGNWLSLYSVF
jgi:hypothetical protein